MAYVRMRFDVAGDVEYSRAFEVYAHEAGDLTKPLQRIGHDLILAIGQQFLTEGGFGLGFKWQPLSPAYAAWKEEHFPGRPLLVATSEMRSEMLNEKAAVHVYADRLVYEPEGERAEQGIPLFHQKGKGHNPARPMVVLNTITRRGWDRIVHEWLIEIRRGPLGVAA